MPEGVSLLRMEATQNSALSDRDVQIPHHEHSEVLTELSMTIRERGVITVEDWKRAVKVAQDTSARAEADLYPAHNR